MVGDTDYWSVLLLDVLKFKNPGIFKSEIAIWLLLIVSNLLILLIQQIFIKCLQCGKNYIRCGGTWP